MFFAAFRALRAPNALRALRAPNALRALRAPNVSRAPFQAQLAQLRRKQILDAAVTVFAERGFHRTTIRDVAKAAGVADGTIYNYFENKTALLLGILDPLNDRERITELPPFELPSDPRDFFRHFFARRWLAFSGQNLPALRVLLSEVLVNPKLCVPFVERVVAPTIQLAEPVFQRYVDAGTLRPIDLSLALRALVGTFLGLLLLRLMGDKAVEDAWADLPDLLATLLLDGLLPD